MHGPEHAAQDVQWSRQGDAWVGSLDGREGLEIELLLRATDWHIEVSYVARGAFEREHIQAADAEEAKAIAADLLRAFWTKCEEHAADAREVGPSVQGEVASMRARSPGDVKETAAMLVVSDNPAMSRFEMTSGDAIAFVEYRHAGDRIVLTHTEVPEALSGQGIGSKLVAGVLDELRLRHEGSCTMRVRGDVHQAASRLLES